MKTARALPVALMLVLTACTPHRPPADQPANLPPSPTAPDAKQPTTPTPAPEPKPESAPPPVANSGAILTSLVGTWRLVSLNAHDITPRAASLPKPPTIAFAADAGISGFAGVNRFTGRLGTPGLAHGTFKTSPLAMTRMAGPPDAMQLEGEFVTALSKATAFVLEGDTLELRSDAAPLARLERVK